MCFFLFPQDTFKKRWTKLITHMHLEPHTLPLPPSAYKAWKLWENTVTASFWLQYIFAIKWFGRLSGWTPADCLQSSNIPYHQELTLEALPSLLKLCSEKHCVVICTSWVLLCISLKQDKEAFNRNLPLLYSFCFCFCHYHVSALFSFPSQFFSYFPDHSSACAQCHDEV